MTDGQRMLHDMVRKGPYQGQDTMGASVCGFCGETASLGKHYKDCPWPRFRDGIFATWPEWKPNENHFDMQARIDAEHEAREAATEWKDL